MIFNEMDHDNQGTDTSEQYRGRCYHAKVPGWAPQDGGCRSDFRRCRVRLGGVACFGEFDGSEDRDGQSNQDRAENPGEGE